MRAQFSFVNENLDEFLIISDLQNLILRHSLPLDVTVDVKQELKSDSKTENVRNFSREQLMHIKGKVPEELCDGLSNILHMQNGDKIHIILVVDNSGSMSGNPFNQVKTALVEIIDQCVGDAGKVVDIILYNSTARAISFTADNYKDTIGELKANGLTNFKAAFAMTQSVIEQRNEDFSHTVILFMTDGRDTVSDACTLYKCVEEWATFLQNFHQQVTVHSIGFSACHDLQFLRKISEAGNQPGMYRYCEPEDGPEALADKLEELFSFVSYSGGRPIEFEITMKRKDSKLLLTGSQSGNIQGNITLVENVHGSKDLIVSGECWISLSDTASLPEVSVAICLNCKKQNRASFTLPISCEVRNLTRTVIADAVGMLLWDLTILSRDTDVLTLQLADTIKTGGDVKGLMSRVDLLQTCISRVQIFKPDHDKDTRARTLEFIRDTKAKVDKLYSLLSHCLRGEAKNVPLLARAEDLKYDANFSKSRRQRLMDRRVTKNFGAVKYHAQRATVATEESLRSLSKDALNFYFCILSMYSVKDILMDEDELENAIGIGLAVARSEHVVDNPTLLRVYSISGALVSRSSVMDAMKYKISTEDPLSAHGGFSFVNMQTFDPSYATVGASREPINAWLPLYICPSHWERVKSCLRPSLGYLCTLDPLGYSENQLDIFFMILGGMIGQLWEDSVGENQLKIIFALQRTCQACIEEFKLESSITDVVQNFLESPHGRFRNIIPNLFTLIGYLVSLPVSVTKRLLKISDENTGEMSSYSRLWLAFITESLRRATASKPELHKDENTTTSLLNILLHGRNDAGQTSEFKHFIGEETAHCFGHVSRVLAQKENKTANFDIPVYDLKKEVKLLKPNIQPSAEVEPAMEIWAQAQCGVIPNNTEQVSNASRIVQEWMAVVKKETSFQDEETTKTLAPTNMASNTETEGPLSCAASPSTKYLNHKKFDSTGGLFPQRWIDGFKLTMVQIFQKLTAPPSTTFHAKEEVKKKVMMFPTQSMNSSIFEVTAKLLSQLSLHAYPPLSALPACMCFLHHCITNNLNHKEFDSTGGLLPQSWIDGFKLTMVQTFQKLTEFQSDCDAAAVAAKENSHSSVDESLRDDTREDDLNIKDNKADEGQVTDSDDENSVKNSLKSACAATRKQIVTAPMLLSLIGLNTGNLPLLLVRAMLCQAVTYTSNKHAREAADSGQLTDLAIKPEESAHTYLCSVKAKLLENKNSLLKKMTEQAVFEIGNTCMLQAQSVWAFIGYLMQTYQERGEGFSSLMDLILSCSDRERYPLLAEKIQVLLVGKYQKVIVFAKGNVWIPDRKVSKCLRALFGEEIWKDIEKELRSNMQIHIYRESNIPNRHGYCNSNPYIPNELREILGMPLTEERKQARRRVKGK